ncbi:MAG: serine/threonine-protein kinase, partial [Eubacteriales bacterium]|nr:serine/threonine-protein kinase [Eubacteriales bacterium]
MGNAQNFTNIQLPWPEWSIVNILGSGTFGKVYEIQKLENGRTQKAALKVLKIPMDISEVYSLRAEGLNDQQINDYFYEIAQRQENEIILMEELQTATNIVSIKDSKILRQESGIGFQQYIMMELLTSLDQHCYGSNTSRVLTVEDVIKIGSNICDALTACEKSDIIHRDIKPSNIFVSKYGEYKLGDFGVSRHVGQTQNNMSVQGTINYMAPEIFRNERHYGNTVDIYSLGLVLYRLLNLGRLPFVRPFGTAPSYEENSQAFTQRMQGKDPLPDPALGGPALANVLRKACSYRPEDRYQHAENMKKDLLRCSLSMPQEELSKEIIPKKPTTS